MTSRVIEETHHVYGRLTVVRRAEAQQRGARWLCHCACGGTCVVLGDDLRSGHTRSCGCLLRDLTRTHGEAGQRTRTQEYRAWAHMIERCTKPNHSSWPHYGGRGIAVCARWRASFEQFLLDMGRCQPGFSLDRIDNDAGYAPDNCRWATRQQQAVNTQQVRHVQLDGTRVTVAQMAHRLALPTEMLRRRLRLAEESLAGLDTPTA